MSTSRADNDNVSTELPPSAQAEPVQNIENNDEDVAVDQKADAPAKTEEQEPNESNDDQTKRSVMVYVKDTFYIFPYEVMPDVETILQSKPSPLTDLLLSSLCLTSISIKEILRKIMSELVAEVQQDNADEQEENADEQEENADAQEDVAEENNASTSRPSATPGTFFSASAHPAVRIPIQIIDENEANADEVEEPKVTFKSA